MTAPHPQSASQVLAHALLLLARDQHAASEQDQASALLERAWRALTNPRDTSQETQKLRTLILYQQGMVAIHRANWTLAMVTLRQALLRAHRSHPEDHPERIEIHNALALAARRVGKFTVAAEHLHQGLLHAQGEQKLLLHRNAAHLELDRNRPEFAEPHAQKAVKLDPGEAQQFLLGRCLLALGKTQAALCTLKTTAQSTNPSIRHQSRSLITQALTGA